MGTRARIAIGALAVVAIVVAFVIASGSGDDDGAVTTGTQPVGTTPGDTGASPPAARPRIPVVTVRDGRPVGGVRRLEFRKGQRIRFRVRSDEAVEVHAHGYDIARDVPANGSVTFSFPGSIDGIFVVELEATGVEIAMLEVSAS